MIVPAPGALRETEAPRFRSRGPSFGSTRADRSTLRVLGDELRAHKEKKTKAVAAAPDATPATTGEESAE